MSISASLLPLPQTPILFLAKSAASNLATADSLALEIGRAFPHNQTRDKYTKGRQAKQPLWGESLVGI